MKRRNQFRIDLKKKKFLHLYFFLSFRADAIFERQKLEDKEPYASPKIWEAVRSSENEELTLFLTGDLPFGSMYMLRV